MIKNKNNGKGVNRRDLPASLTKRVASLLSLNFHSTSDFDKNTPRSTLGMKGVIFSMEEWRFEYSLWGRYNKCLAEIRIEIKFSTKRRCVTCYAKVAVEGGETCPKIVIYLLYTYKKLYYKRESSVSKIHR